MPKGVYDRLAAKGMSLEEKIAYKKGYMDKYRKENKQAVLQYSRDYYEAHADRYREAARARKQEKRPEDIAARRKRAASKRGLLWCYKSEHPCCRCGEADPACLDFHHRNPGDKIFELGTHGHNHSWDELVSEIEKCDILCANCHRKLHYYGSK